MTYTSNKPESCGCTPSEAFKWLLFPGTRKQCWECGKEPLRVQDVGQHRRKYPGGKDQFLCKSCQTLKVETAIEEKRRALGLQI